MRELRGSYRVHFVVALVLCGLALLIVGASWLPGKSMVPRWPAVGVFLLTFPVFGAALIRTLFSGVAGSLLGPGNAGSLARYVWHLPRGLMAFYAAIVCVAGLGVATAGSAPDPKADEHGYYYTDWDNNTLRSERFPLTRAEYHQARKENDRVFAAVPAAFYAVSSFLVLASASAAAAGRGEAERDR